MSEKRKWFDPQKPVDAPLRLLAASNVVYADAMELLHAVTVLHERQRLPEDSFKLLTSLCQMPPAARLSRNHKVILTLLAERSVRSVLSDGLTDGEKLALRDLEHLHAPPKIRAIAQGLLNVRERQQLADAVQEMYRDERSRCWRADPS